MYRAVLRGAALLGVCAGVLAWVAPMQDTEYDEPLVPAEVSGNDIEMRGRFVRQWKDPAGALVLVYTGGFELTQGARRLTAGSAVVWIEPRTDATAKKYYELTVHLSEEAVVREPAGTTTEDTVLLVRNLRTSGQIIKFSDAKSAEPVDESPLYQQALRDRRAVETAQPPALPPAIVPTTAPASQPDVARPPAERERKPRVVRYRLNSIEPADTPEGERIYVSSGGVYFSQAGGVDSPMLEIRADNAVVFLAREAGAGLLRAAVGEPPSSRPAVADTQPAAPSAPDGTGRRTAPGAVERPAAQQPGELSLSPFGRDASVRAVYLEGDVILSLGNRVVRAARLYYDFEHSRALILDAVFRADVPERNIPLYVRAAEIRQLSAREFSARKAIVTTSEFHTPSYHVGAERVVLRDLTARDAAGRAADTVSGEYELKDATLNVGGFPIAYWPYSKGRLDVTETALRRFRMGYSERFGAEVETRWHLFNLMGVSAPPGYDATLRLDYFGRRGPATGVDVDYQRDDQYGLARTYFLHDDGEDHLGPLRRDEEWPDTNERGRFLWRHRHLLPHDWELTLELAYISDPNFLEEYEKSEFFEGKDQETLIRLKRAKDTEALTFLANWRMLDFATQTEHLPEVAYRRIGDTFFAPVILYHESRIGTVRYRPDDRRSFSETLFHNTSATDVTFRGDVRQEAELPLKLGPVNAAPFASVRGSYWDGQPLAGGGLWRGLGVYGVRGSSTWSRVFDGVESSLLDIHKLRHVIKPDFAAWWANSNTRAERITPFDEGVETLWDAYGATLGLRQTFQTRRGAADRERTTDLATVNVEAGFFGDQQPGEVSNGYANPLRPEDSRTRNYIAGDLAYRLSDTTSFLYDFNYDINDRSFDRQDFAVAVERLPRLSYVFGLRHAGDVDMTLLGGGWNYKLSEKHITAVRVWQDIGVGRLGEISVGYVRKFPRWYSSITLEYSQVDDDLSVSFSLWPEGVPEWRIGSGRFQNLGESTGIRP